jgi:hypothetical protein
MTATPTDARPGVPEPLEDEASYGTRVEEAFIEERGTPFFLLPKDWQLIKGWREAGVPSDTVIRAVRTAFERKRARGDASKISSLSYCGNAVEVAWEMGEGLVGAHVARPAEEKGESTPFDGGPRLRELAEALREAEASIPAGTDTDAAAGALRAAREAVEELDPSTGLEELEDELGKAEKALVKKLEKALDEPERESLARRVEEEAGDVSTLTKETQRRIHSAIRRRAVRKAFGLTPLTLLGG